MDDDRAYDVASLAAKWRCSTDAIYDMIDTGALRFFMIGRADKKGKRKGIRISAKEVARCQGEFESESPPTRTTAGHSSGMEKRLLRNAAKMATANG